MKSTVDLSIVIPTFHRNVELREALISALAVPELSLEVIVVDDSPGGLAEPVLRSMADPRLRYLRQQPPSGGYPGLTRNTGVAASNGRLIYFLDDDDRAISPHLLRACRMLDAAPQGVLVCAPRVFGPSPALNISEQAYFDGAMDFLMRARGRWSVVARLLFGRALLVCSTCLIKRTAFDAVGGMDAEMPLLEDLDFYLRAIRDTGHLVMPEPLVERRVGASSLITEAAPESWRRGYRQIHRKYRDQKGVLEFFALKIWHRLMVGLS